MSDLNICVWIYNFYVILATLITYNLNTSWDLNIFVLVIYFIFKISIKILYDDCEAPYEYI